MTSARASSPPSAPRGVAREVLRLAGPAVLTSFLQTLVFLADRLLLGRYSEPALASMQVQGPIVWSVFSVFAGLTVGTVPLVARATGEGNRKRAGEVARASLRVAFVLGLGVTAAGLAVVKPLVALIGPSSASLRALSVSYLTVILLGFPQMFVATAAGMVLTGAGDTRTPFTVGLVSNTLNVAGDVLLIFGWHIGPFTVPAFGVAGAAASSVVAFTVEAALLLWVLHRADQPARIQRIFGKSSADGRDARRALLAISTPALFERLVIHAGFLTYVAIINRLGALVMAGNQAMITLEATCFLGADGFGVATATVVGQALGRGDPRAARRGGFIATGLCVAVLTAAGLVIWATGPLTLRLFVPEGSSGSDLVRTAMSAMPLLALSQPFMAAAGVLSQGLRGAGDTRSPLVAGVVGGFAVRVALVAWLGLELGLGLRAVWIASGVDWVARTLIAGGVFASGRWTRIRV
jgi:MATE family, multidrug efflux pump